MLHFNTIYPETLELLKKLQSYYDFKELRLVGGTSLALQIGHRISIDIDLFGQIEFDDMLLFKLSKDFDSFIHIKKSKNINIFTINNIKVDFVNYPYPWLNKSVEEKNIVMASLPDIAAMKLSAISGRGSKKDFIDIYYLLQYYSLNQMLGFYKQKFNDGSEFLVMRSLSYFEDAENSEMPIMINTVDWNDVKKSIKAEVIKIS